MNLERDVNKLLIIAVGAAVVADILANGQAAKAVLEAIGGILNSILRAAAGQKVT